MRSKLAKKRTKKRQTKTTVGKKLAPMKKAIEMKPALRKVTPKKGGGKSRRLAARRQRTGKRRTHLRNRFARKARAWKRCHSHSRGTWSTIGRANRDLQDLSNVEGADSQSVDELFEEGNAFEANVVKGVEDAEDDDEVEVRTHEVPHRDWLSATSHVDCLRRIHEHIGSNQT